MREKSRELVADHAVDLEKWRQFAEDHVDLSLGREVVALVLLVLALHLLFELLFELQDGCIESLLIPSGPSNPV